MQEPSLNELLPALSQFAHTKPGLPHGQHSREENERQEYQYDEGNDEMIELQLVGNSENGTNGERERENESDVRNGRNNENETKTRKLVKSSE